MKKTFAALMAFFLVISMIPACFAGTDTDTASDADKTAETAAAAPVYESLEDIDFSDYKLVVVNYWEPSCCWCKKEMPDFEALYQEYKDQGVLIVGMYSETDDFEEAMEEVGEISYPLIRYTDPDDLPGDGAIPVTVFYDSEGQILPPEEDEIRSFYIAYYNNEIETFDPAEYEEEELEKITAYVEKLKNDKTAFDALVQEKTDADLSCPDVFAGYAYGENWRERIESRLNPQQE